MKTSGLDIDWTLLLLVGEVFLNVLLATGILCSLLTECEIVSIDQN